MVLLSSEEAPRKLYRSRVDRILGGVCGGLAEHFNIDPTIVRLLFVAFFVINPAAAAIIYIAAWVIIPEKPYLTPEERMALEKAGVKKREEGLILIGLLLILAGVIGAARMLVILRDISSMILIIIGLFIVIVALFKRK